MYVLDTNVLSEVIRASPDHRVVAWMTAQAHDQLYTTAVTQAEMLYGTACMPTGRRREILSGSVTKIFSEEFRNRILAFDAAAAPIYASLLVRSRIDGRAMSQFDAQIAAIALSKGAVLVTRNVKDFSTPGLAVLDPWAGIPIIEP